VGIRLLVLDDNPHVRWDGRTHGVDATFHRFLAALLDVEGGPVERLDHLVPLAEATHEPAGLTVDPRIHTVAGAPFSSIADYLRRAPALTRQNGPILRRAIRSADLVLLRLPASNAPLAAAIARMLGRPLFGYVAGSAREVAAARDLRVPVRLAAAVVGSAYDLVSRIAAGDARTITVGRNLAAGGVVTSLVEPGEIRDPAARPDVVEPGELRLAWAGRLAAGKGLETLFEAVEILASDPPAGRAPRLIVLGDGPLRRDLAARSRQGAAAGLIDLHGHVADRGRYLDLLASADIFVFPSPAEGFPKVILDAAAVGLPVLASPVGALAELAAAGIIEGVRPGDPGRLAAALGALAADPRRAAALRGAGTAFARDHTRAAEASRLVARLQSAYPSLPWS
jgi:glycosyltransferase involved in cell wall biosynthesis